ncbi:hypothetical protein HMI51_03505 [Corallococcus coralloides]|nr:hypothetical protein [Corallococcus coralloides]
MRLILLFTLLASSTASADDGPTREEFLQALVAKEEALRSISAKSQNGLESISSLLVTASVIAPQPLKTRGLTDANIQSIAITRLQRAGFNVSSNDDNSPPTLSIVISSIPVEVDRKSRHFTITRLRLQQRVVIASDGREMVATTWEHDGLALAPGSVQGGVEEATGELLSAINSLVDDWHEAQKRAARIKLMTTVVDGAKTLKKWDDVLKEHQSSRTASNESPEFKKQRRATFYNSPNTPRDDPDFYTTTSGADATTFVRMFRLKELNPAKRKELLESDAERFGCVAQTFLEMGFSRLSVQEMDTHEEVVKEMASLKPSDKCESGQAGDKQTSAQD